MYVKRKATLCVAYNIIGKYVMFVILVMLCVLSHLSIRKGFLGSKGLSEHG
jgi:hypothetical protein